MLPRSVTLGFLAFSALLVSLTTRSSRHAYGMLFLVSSSFSAFVQDFNFSGAHSTVAKRIELPCELRLAAVYDTSAAFCVSADDIQRMPKSACTSDTIPKNGTMMRKLHGRKRCRDERQRTECEPATSKKPALATTLSKMRYSGKMFSDERS